MNDLLKENRARGWESVPDHGPTPAQRDYITKWRQAQIEKRSVSPIVQAFNNYCEQRSLALGHEVRKSLRPITGKMSFAEARRLSRSTGRSLEDIVYGYSPKINEDRWLRMRLASITATVTRDAKKLKDEKRNELLNRAANSADGKLALLDYLDTLAGVKPASPGALPYGFLDLRTEDGGAVSDPQQLLRTHPYFQEGEDDPWDDDDVSDEDVRCHHIRCASGHAGCARQSSFEQGCAHVKAQSAHTKAASESRSRNRTASREARAASYRANHWSNAQVS